MATYIVLGKFTDEGAKDIQNLRQAVEENGRHAEQLGLRSKGWYLTMGQYDYMIIVEGPNDEAIAAQVLGVAGRGRTRTETLRAFTLDEVDALIQKLS